MEDAIDLGPGLFGRRRVIFNPDGTPAVLGPSAVTAAASFLPAAAAYSAGDIIEGVKEFAFAYSDGTAAPPGSLIRVLTAIMKIDQTAILANETSYTLQCYDKAAPGAVLNDNDAWTLASAELSAYRGPIGLGTPVDLGAACYVKSPGIDLDVKLSTGASSLWGRLVTVGNPTFTAVARQIFLYGVVL